MKFDFDTAAKLAKDHPVEFEKYRREVLLAKINTFRPETRFVATQLQLELDELREQLSPEEFIIELFSRLNSNLVMLDQKFLRLHNLVSDNPIIRAYVSKR